MAVCKRKFDIINFSTFASHDPRLVSIQSPITKKTMAALRDDMLKSAVSFLSDPKVQSAPLAKKVAFLENKGMTSEEIEEAMARVNGKSAATTVTTTTSGPVTYPGGGVVMQAPPVPARASYDWRDVFIAAVMAGGVGYGVWHLAKVSKELQSKWVTLVLL